MKEEIGSSLWTSRYRLSHNEWCKNKSPAFFYASGGKSMKVPYPKITSSNGLRRAICNFMQWEGHHLEPTNNMGRPVQRKVPKFNLLAGKVEYLFGGIEWQKGSGMTGSSDAKGHISRKNDYAIPLYVEIKYGKDTQSHEQIEYEQKINDTGGIYIVVKTIQGWFLWYDAFLLTL